MTSTSAATDAAREVLHLIWDGPRPADLELATALDRLIAAHDLTPETHPSERDDEPPERDYEAAYAALTLRYPDFDWYPVADEGAAADAPPVLADAVDDLADITQDMREVLWRAEHLGQDDAQWAFRLYFFHWSRHARHLAAYLRGRSLP